MGGASFTLENKMNKFWPGILTLTQVEVTFALKTLGKKGNIKDLYR